MSNKGKILLDLSASQPKHINLCSSGFSSCSIFSSPRTQLRRKIENPQQQLRCIRWSSVTLEVNINQQKKSKHKYSGKHSAFDFYFKWVQNTLLNLGYIQIYKVSQGKNSSSSQCSTMKILSTYNDAIFGRALDHAFFDIHRIEINIRNSFLKLRQNQNLQTCFLKEMSR